MGVKPLISPQCSHRGDPVRVGTYEIYAGGVQYFACNDDLVGYDLLVLLTNGAPLGLVFGQRYAILAAPLIDFGGVSPEWLTLLNEVKGELEAGKRILAYCVGSHGRTGCFLGSLIALLESRDETPDPIAAVRERHCEKAVETRAQAEAIFAIRGEQLPAHYVEEFTRPTPKKEN